MYSYRELERLPFFGDRSIKLSGFCGKIFCEIAFNVY